MNTILAKIAATKKQEVIAAKQKKTIHQLGDHPTLPTRDFIQPLACNQLNIIAEIKKASPSQGIICPNFDVAQIAKTYEQHGASCLSVLTDKSYFQGAHEHIAIAKENSTLPVLRKDFIIDPYQIYESSALGADCILLIVALLDDQQLMDYCQLAQQLNMAVLVESHSLEELERALLLPTPLIGINNRDLNTFKTDITTSITLAHLLPDDKILVTESGIHSQADMQMMLRDGIHTFLIGESLMRSANIGLKLQELLNSKETNP